MPVAGAPETFPCAPREGKGNPMANWHKMNWAVREGIVLVNLDNAVSIRQAPNDDRYVHKGQVTRIIFSEGSSGDYIDVADGLDAVHAMASGGNS